MLEKLTEKEFNEFAISHNNSIFFQSSYWGKLKQGTGWKYSLVGIKKDGKLEAASLLLSKKIPVFNKYIFYSPRGFLIDYSNKELLKQYTEEIKRYVKKENGIFFKINPLVIYQERNKNGEIVEGGINNDELVTYLKKLGYKHTGFTITYGKDLEPRWISVLDVKNKTLDEIQSYYKATTRWEVRSAYKHGLEIVSIDESRMSEFKELMQHTGERRGFIDRPLSYYKKMYQEFKDYIKVMLVELNVEKTLETYQIAKQKLIDKFEKETSKQKRKENLIKELQDQIESTNKKIDELTKLKEQYGKKIVIAGGLFLCFGKQVVSLFGASYKEFMKYKGQYFLNNEMIKYAIENGYEKYNFYGITGEFNEESPMYGLFDFKRGFNAEVEELIGEFTYVTNSFYNNLYNIMFKTYRTLKRLRK